MTLLEQCQIWNENDEYQKIIDTIEAIPEEKLTPELCSELARAYNNAADIGDREMFEKALALLLPYADHFQGEHTWNFRVGYAYYYLNQESLALPYFEQALEARPGDADTLQMIEDCRRQLALPRFAKNFRERTEETWKTFRRKEAQLRQLLDIKDRSAVQEELVALCESALLPAFPDPAFEVGHSGQKYELILSSEGNLARLYELDYFQRHAPAELLEHWNFHVGRQASANFSLRTSAGLEISGTEVQVLPEKTEDDFLALTLYCEALLPLLQEDENQAWWLLSTLVDQVLGEIPSMALIRGFEVSAEPLGPDAFLLSELPDRVQAMGFEVPATAEEYLATAYSVYQLEPEQDPEADWRLDTTVGSTRFPMLIGDYLRGESDTVDLLYRDGAAAGFLLYPLDLFDGEDRGDRIMEFRDQLEAALTEQAGEDALTLLGGATGLYHGYLDLIAWDLPAVLSAAVDFFNQSGLAWSSFHSFRRDVGTVRLTAPEAGAPELAPEPELQLHPETGSLLAPEDIEVMESFLDEKSGYFYRVLSYLTTFIENGVKENSFTEKQAREDLQIALWYSYACMNIDEYEFYYRGVQWMRDSEKNATGCGTWYYRFSIGLTYCGKLEEALRYAEQGALEEPDYPWIWLHLGKLRSHFGDRDGALAAAQRGLELVPGDHEFTTLRQEILNGATLQEMEYHWIHPDADLLLQKGLDADADSKLRAISCIVTNPEGLDCFLELFHPDPDSFETDSPYCSFPYSVQGQTVELVFGMNLAGISNLREDWLRLQKERLDCGMWLTLPDGTPGTLHSVFFGLDYQVMLGWAPEPDQLVPIRLDEAGLPLPEEPESEEADGDFSETELYTSEELAKVEEHISRFYGEFEMVLHEVVSPDIHVDICLIPPTAEKNYYTLVTMGMGAHRMTLPEELADQGLDRAELLIALPPDWKLDHDSLQDERWYWPIRLLKSLARLPGISDTWLGWGHTVDNQEPYADNTELSGAILVVPQQVDEEGFSCQLPGGEEVNFYQLLPLYEDEMEYKIQSGADSLLELYEGTSFIVDPERPNLLAEDTPLTQDEIKDLLDRMDDAEWHLQDLREKQLPVEELTAYNHLAIYLRWNLEHGRMSEEFRSRYKELMQQFAADPSGTDLRLFIRDELGGILRHSMFDEEGSAFSSYYYGQNEAPYFPSDIDDYALRRFGPKEYFAEKYQDETYLFIPFDEVYYQDMARLIQQRWEAWQQYEPSDEEPDELAQATMQYLGCDCEYFPPMRDDDPITAAYSYARRRGMEEGFLPVLVVPSESLWETLILNSDPDSDGAEDYGFDPVRVAKYRKMALSAAPLDGKAILKARMEERIAELEENDIRREEILGEMEGGEPQDRFLSYWDYDTQRTCPMILAKVPVKQPWEIFAYLPFGGWNDCPDAAELMAVSRTWAEQYGAVPAVLTQDVLEYALPAPVPAEQAMELAIEQYSLCPDVVEQGAEEVSIGWLADVLHQSDKWYFWWD